MRSTAAVLITLDATELPDLAPEAATSLEHALTLMESRASIGAPELLRMAPDGARTN